MAKLIRFHAKYRHAVAYWCPGCDNTHKITIDSPNGVGAKWSFDGNAAAPTFSPSINYRCNTPDMEHYQKDAASTVCHHFVKAGRIQFLDDCTHGLKGRTVDLPDFPAHVYMGCERL